MIIGMSLQEALSFPIRLSNNLPFCALHTDTPIETS